MYKFKQDLLDKINLFIYKADKQLEIQTDKLRTVINDMQSIFSNRQDLIKQMTSTIENQVKSLQADVGSFKKLKE